MAQQFKKILVGTDRFGTKTYNVLVSCQRCGGSGRMPFLVDNGICYRCGGSGKEWEKEKEYTPERRAQLDAQNARRAEKKREQQEAQRLAEYETNKSQSLSREGFSAEGQTWVFLGDTYSIKDALKALGARFNQVFGWHIDHPVSEYQTIQVALEQVADISAWGRIEYKEDARRTVDRLKADATRDPDAPVSEWVGTEKQRMTLELTLDREVTIDTVYGEMHIYTFHQGNDILVWKTSSCIWLDDEETKAAPVGTKIKAKATVKAHTEYRGVKQTELTRLAIVA